jgi:hypothetical protein
MIRRLCIRQMLFGFGLPAMLLAAPVGSAAAQAASGFVAAEVAPASDTFWTPHRLINAVPMAVSPSAGFAPAPLSAAPPAAGKSEGGPGKPPTVLIPPQADDLVHGPVDLDRLAPSGVAPNASLGFRLFTESRVIPPNTGQAAAAVDAYPFRAVGKFFFHDPRTGQDFFCSAAVNGARVIVTAAQCVAHGSPSASQRYYYSNFLFIPALDNGAARYGSWKATFHVISNAWWFSGVVPNPADFALLQAVDRDGMTLGSVVGTLGWRTFGLSLNHFTTLGYTSDLDGGVLMQRNDAQTSRFGGNNTWQQGSDLGPGIAGGPWVQDFGLNPTGGSSNLIVGVTSYLPASGIGFIGASQFYQLFSNMRSFICSHQPGNC